MIIAVGNVTKCYVCGEEPNEKEHICKWETAYINNKGASMVHVSSIRRLILDAYHRGRKDGSNGLTIQQELKLQSLLNGLAKAEEDIISILGYGKEVPKHSVR